MWYRLAVRLKEKMIINSKNTTEMMKKMFLGVAFALAALMPVNAQRNAKAQNISPEQAIEMRTNRMAKRLMLDDATTAKFTPIYKEYLTELQECTKNCPNAANCPANGQKCAAMTDADIEKCIEQRFDMQQKKLDIRKNYYKKLKTVLNMKQMQALFCAPAGPGRDGKCPLGNKKPAQRKQMKRNMP